MIFTRTIRNPHQWHSYFAVLPVLVQEASDYEAPSLLAEPVQVLREEYACLQKVERMLEKNMTGTRRWIYRRIKVA
jgi:hypothetical protein